MIDRHDAGRIADAITALRPAWGRAQLMAVIGDQRIRAHRQPSDIAAALAWLAMDPATREPTRLFEGGPWWGTATAYTAERNTSAHIRHASPLDCGDCGHPESRHTPTGINDHPYVNSIRRPSARAPQGLIP